MHVQMVQWPAVYIYSSALLHLFSTSSEFISGANQRMTQTTIDVYCCHTLQVVIHEALMLLKDCCQDTGAEGHDVTTTTSSSKAAALRFIEAVSNTKSLSRPKHINVTSSHCC